MGRRGVSGYFHLTVILPLKVRLQCSLIQSACEKWEWIRWAGRSLEGLLGTQLRTRGRAAKGKDAVDEAQKTIFGALLFALREHNIQVLCLELILEQYFSVEFPADRQEGGVKIANYCLCDE